jgi:hypothetical protein
MFTRVVTIGWAVSAVVLALGCAENTGGRDPVTNTNYATAAGGPRAATPPRDATRPRDATPPPRDGGTIPRRDAAGGGGGGGGGGLPFPTGDAGLPIPGDGGLGGFGMCTTDADCESGEICCGVDAFRICISGLPICPL